MAEGKKAESKQKLISRRKFLIGSGAVIAAGALTACTPKTVTNTVTETQTKTATTTSVPPASTVSMTTTATATTTATTTLPAVTSTTTVAPVYAASTAYLAYDSRRCAGCQSCMMACSLTHNGEASLSLSRIQITRNLTVRYPYDVQIAVCRQCTTPLCVTSCPVGAAKIDTANGNIRVIDDAKCTGCGNCIAACPHEPHRTVWNPVTKKASKCDLCITAPYYSQKGGPTGTPACVAVCPMAALSVVKTGTAVDINMTPPPTTTTTTAPPATTTTTTSKPPTTTTSTPPPVTTSTTTAPSGSPVKITWQQAKDYMGKDVVVTVTGLTISTMVVFDPSITLFMGGEAGAGLDILFVDPKLYSDAEYLKKTIAVTGKVIANSYGTPQINITAKSQIVVVS